MEDIVKGLQELLSDDNFPDYCRLLLKIQSKNQGLIPLELSASQKLLFETWMKEKQKNQGKSAVRIIALKARQVYWSTGTEAICYRETTTHSDYKSTIIAHLDEASQNLFRIFRVFYDHCPPGLRPHLRSMGNKRGLDFDILRSSIRVLTAESPQSSSSATNNFLHISELSKWRDAENAMTALLQTLSANGTAIVESTAYGVGGYFYDLWNESVNSQGRNGWTPLFFPWWRHEEYRIPLDPGEAIYPTTEEEVYVKRFNLTGEQVKWMRWCRAANCLGSWDAFRQEYPAYPEEAFISSGRPVFDLPAVLQQETNSEAFKPTYADPQLIGKAIFVNPRSDGNGDAEIYHNPLFNYGRRYVFGIDTMEGRNVETRSLAKKIGGSADYNACVVLDRITQTQVALLRNQDVPEVFAEKVFALYLFYSGDLLKHKSFLPFIVPEINGSGLAFMVKYRQLMDEYGIPVSRIYHRSQDVEGEASVTAAVSGDKVGFRTTMTTKKLLISELQGRLFKNLIHLRSPQIVREMKTYVYLGTGQMSAQSGHYDDCVMATALACWGDRIDAPPYELSGWTVMHPTRGFLRSAGGKIMGGKFGGCGSYWAR